MDDEVLANVSGPIRVILTECTRLTALISVCALGQRVVMLARYCLLSPMDLPAGRRTLEPSKPDGHHSITVPDDFIGSQFPAAPIRFRCSTSFSFSHTNSMSSVSGCNSNVSVMVHGRV